MDQQKLDFLLNDVLPLLRTLPATAIGHWGKMNAWQMVEHVAGFFSVSTNKLHFPLVTPPEHLPRMKEFLRSEKEFRENTKAPVLSEEPLPVQFKSYEAALDALEQEIKDFISLFSTTPGLITQHPVFGDLDFEEWVLLHHKHVTHHLKQFGLQVQ